MLSGTDVKTNPGHDPADRGHNSGTSERNFDRSRTFNNERGSDRGRTFNNDRNSRDNRSFDRGRTEPFRDNRSFDRGRSSDRGRGFERHDGDRGRGFERHDGDRGRAFFHEGRVSRFEKKFAGLGLKKK